MGLYENRTGPDQDLMQVLTKSKLTSYFVKPRQQAHEGLVPPIPQMTRMNAIGLVAKAALQEEHLLDLPGLEVIAQAWLGSEATRTPEGFHCFNLKNTPIVNILISVNG